MIEIDKTNFIISLIMSYEKSVTLDAHIIQLTTKIKAAAGYLDIQVMDHIIVSDEGYYSFADEGLM
jgi:DNA repair protein RadC